MISPTRKAILWVIATLLVALLPQLPRMPAAVAAATLLPLAWRVGAEFRGWKSLPAWVRHGATAASLAALFLSYGNLSGRRAAVSLLAGAPAALACASASWGIMLSRMVWRSALVLLGAPETSMSVS